MSRQKRSKIKGGFVLIPKLTIKCNQYKSLKDYTKSVYTAILTEFIRDTRLNPENLVKIPHTQIEYISGVSHSSVVRAMRQLKDHQFLRVNEPGGLEGNCTTFQLNGRYIDSGNLESRW